MILRLTHYVYRVQKNSYFWLIEGMINWSVHTLTEKSVLPIKRTWGSKCNSKKRIYGVVMTEEMLENLNKDMICG